tara:strand:+ start:171 stop:1610 length:1440 start_codon:yes stop_codon:yes gene_type:complete
VITAIIAYKQDSIERKRNLNFLIKVLKKNSIEVIIAEQKESIDNDGELKKYRKPGEIWLEYYSNKPFHKSKLYNLSAQICVTQNILLLDADVILDFKVLPELCKLSDLCRPFSEIFSLSNSETEEYINNGVPPNLKDKTGDDYTGKYSILISKDLFLRSGGFDEDIAGWGWEDLDFIHNKLKDYSSYIPINCHGYHLWHPKTNKDYERKNYFIYKNNHSYRRHISFCTAIKNRKFQIEETLEKNIEDNLEYRDFCEFTILDCDSSDRVSEWIIDNFSEYIADGYLKLFKIKDFPYWNASIAKNTCHNLSEGEILVNLDCDNYTGEGGAKIIYDLFSSNKDINCYHQWCKKEWFSGNYGRISFRRDVFEELGGYDESFYGMGYQDTDIIKRCSAMFPNTVGEFKSLKYNKAIKNKKDLSIENLTEEEIKMGFREINNINKSNSEINISNNRLVANEGIFGIRSKILYYDFKKAKFWNLCA